MNAPREFTHYNPAIAKGQPLTANLHQNINHTADNMNQTDHKHLQERLKPMRKYSYWNLPSIPIG